jgi:hypothetical protein
MHRDKEQQHHASHTAHAATAEAEAESVAHARYTARGSIPAVNTESHAAKPSASERAYGHHHHIPGGDRNVSMEHINTHHQEDGTQATRLAIGGKTPVLAKPSASYSNDGSKVGDLAPGPLHVNAGQICDLKLGGKKVTCVLTHGPHPGWVPVNDFEHHAELAHLQTKQAHEIDHARHASHDLAHKGHTHVIRNKPTPASYEKLFVKPHQQAFTANHAHDYFIRGGGEANLLLNVPTWTEDGGGIGERFGSAVDIVKASEPGGPVLPESRFHQVAGPIQVPLFHHNSKVRAGHLTFVYGYVVNNAGEKRMGWINHYLLS